MTRKTGKLVPNPKYWDYYDDCPQDLAVIANYKTTRSFGTACLAERVWDWLGITGILNECLGSKRSRLVQTAAIYMAARGNVILA
ncbi:MAG: hypothetical protein LBE38_04485 [Deltaproteobacteria bacterium]|nr:hypothetical protein [Deltaproteobacteria bacterium]